jgi:N-acetylglucosamine-6-phosphate deacetylase
MTTPLLIENATLVWPGQRSEIGSILIVAGEIAVLDPASEQIPDPCERFDAAGALLTPGLIDIHTHGVHEFSYERDPQDLIEGVARLGRYGTTTVLPTLYTVLQRDSLSKLERLASALSSVTGVDAPGLHLEGPFLALPGAGGATVPGDLTLLDELLAAAGGRVLAMSVSPDSPHILPVIERLQEHQIAVFLTHTQASVAQTQAAFAAGARHATHFYNVFPVPPERESGVRPIGAVEAILAEPGCSVDFICDGVHVDPLVIRMAVLAKGWRGLVAITDSNIGAGRADGIYDTPWGYPVRVSERDAVRVHDSNHPLNGLLAGSALTMDRALSNLIEWLPLSLPEVVAMATYNPARTVGLDRKGTLEVGADADLVLWNRTESGLQARRTWVGGVCVYEQAESPTPVPSKPVHDKLVSI